MLRTPRREPFRQIRRATIPLRTMPGICPRIHGYRTHIFPVAFSFTIHIAVLVYSLKYVTILRSTQKRLIRYIIPDNLPSMTMSFVSIQFNYIHFFSRMLFFFRYPKFLDHLRIIFGDINFVFINENPYYFLIHVQVNFLKTLVLVSKRKFERTVSDLS